MEGQSKYVSVTEASKILGTSRSQIQRLVDRGLLHKFENHKDRRYIWLLRSEVNEVDQMFPVDNNYRLPRSGADGTDLAS